MFKYIVHRSNLMTKAWTVVVISQTIGVIIFQPVYQTSNRQKQELNNSKNVWSQVAKFALSLGLAHLSLDVCNVLYGPRTEWHLSGLARP
jgi:hypothetical protein